MDHPPPNRNTRTLWSALVLVAVVGVVFGRVARHEFLAWDDDQHVVQNRQLNPVSWHSLGRFWTEPYGGLYAPLSYTSFAAETLVARQPAQQGKLGRLNPTVFHLGNLLLHLVCVVLVFVILRRLFRHEPAAVAGALLFGLHPVQVESVAWISETRGLLCGVFSLLAIWRYLCYAGATAGRRSAVLNYAAAAVCFVLALLCKPAAVAVPLVLVVLDVGLLRRPVRRAVLGLGPWFLAAAGWAMLTKSLQPDIASSFVPPLWARPLVAGDTLAFYLYRLFAPLQCGPDYGRTPAMVMQSGWFYLAWLLPVALVGALACFRNRRIWLVAAGLFVAWLVPVLGLVPFDYQRFSTVADRYLYLAMLGPAVALAWFLANRWGRWTVTATGTLLCVLGVISFVQTGHWRDDKTLWKHALKVNPTSIVALHNLAYMYAEKSRADGNDPYHYDMAISIYHEALAIDPDHPESHLNLGIAYFDLGMLRLDAGNTQAAQVLIEKAEKELRHALQLRPDWPLVHYNLGCLAEYAKKDLVEAERHFRKTIELDPGDVRPWVNLASILERQERFDEALATYDEALRRTQSDSEIARKIENLKARCRQRLQEDADAAPAADRPTAAP